VPGFHDVPIKSGSVKVGGGCDSFRMTIQQPTVHARVAAARRRLLDAGIPADEADLDARLLAQHVLRWTTERLLVDAGGAPPADFASQYEHLITRRERREPYAYIVGHQEFWGLQILVTPDVLIPRPETELIVEAVLELDPAGATSIIDVGTGSGCLAVAIAHERPDAQILATDISDAARDVARRNVAAHGVVDRVTIERSDVLDDVAGRFEVIMSNPPYVRTGDRDGIQPEVRFEPETSLYAGADGLDAIRRLVACAPARLLPGGRLIFEFGFGQADAVTQLISHTAGLTMVAVRTDLQDIPRVAIAQATHG